jgi:hypothetical protein
MKKMFNEGNQIHNLISSSGSGSDFLTSYGSGYGSDLTSQKVTVPTVPVPVPQHCVEVTTAVSGGSCPGAQRTHPPGASEVVICCLCVEVTTAVSGGSCPSAPRTRPPGASASGNLLSTCRGHYGGEWGELPRCPKDVPTWCICKW